MSCSVHSPSPSPPSNPHCLSLNSLQLTPTTIKPSPPSNPHRHRHHHQTLTAIKPSLSPPSPPRLDRSQYSHTHTPYHDCHESFCRIGSTALNRRISGTTSSIGPPLILINPRPRLQEVDGEPRRKREGDGKPRRKREDDGRPRWNREDDGNRGGIEMTTGDRGGIEMTTPRREREDDGNNGNDGTTERRDRLNGEKRETNGEQPRSTGKKETDGGSERGFRKVVPDRWEFSNEYFRRGEKRLLCEIHRKKINSNTSNASPPPPPATPVQVVKSVVSPSSSAEEQVISSNSSSQSKSSSYDVSEQLIEENEKLKKENEKLNRELDEIKNLCGNIFSLMSNYANPQSPSTSTVVEDPEKTAMLFGVRIGGKRRRSETEEEDEEEVDDGTELQLKLPGGFSRVKFESFDLNQENDRENITRLDYNPWLRQLLHDQRVCN
ncbi:hypothetical protein ACFE04_027487 [Oxalis oulophora]